MAENELDTRAIASAPVATATAEKSRLTDSASVGGELDDGVALFSAEEGETSEEEPTLMNRSNEDGHALAVGGAALPAAQLPSIAVEGAQLEGRQVAAPLAAQLPVITREMLQHQVDLLCHTVAGTSHSGYIYDEFTRLIKVVQSGEEFTEDMHQELIRRGTLEFGGSKRRTIGSNEPPSP
jgi:hypothetical protein